VSGHHRWADVRNARRFLSGPVGHRVRQARQQLLQAAADAGVTNVRVFGSVARDEDRPDSDVDILVDVPAGVSLLDLIGCQQAMEDILHVRVDLIPADGLKPGIREDALKDAIPLGDPVSPTQSIPGA
jgi:predicted nucleotidyltransferase